jgi:hypothetical protein
MTFKHKVGLLTCLIFFTLSLSAQEKDCTTKELDNRKIIVKYCFSKFLDEDGNELLLIEDSTITEAQVDFAKCVLLMKDVQKHKLFTGDYESRIVKTISDNEWIIYYFTDNPWPVKNSDCVSRMTFSENKEEKTAIFEFVATPSEYEKGDVNRMKYFNVIYTFKDLENGKVRITMKGKSSPPVKVPMWLVKSAFPKAPASAVRDIVTLVKE